MAQLRTLDIREMQVVLDTPDDEDGWENQQRILLHRIDGGRWVCLDPDESLCIHDLAREEHCILDRDPNLYKH